jgi:hypothetical protein
MCAFHPPPVGRCVRALDGRTWPRAEGLVSGAKIHFQTFAPEALDRQVSCALPSLASASARCPPSCFASESAGQQLSELVGRVRRSSQPLRVSPCDIADLRFPARPVPRGRQLPVVIEYLKASADARTIERAHRRNEDSRSQIAARKKKRGRGWHWSVACRQGAEEPHVWFGTDRAWQISQTNITSALISFSTAIAVRLLPEDGFVNEPPICSNNLLVFGR